MKNTINKIPTIHIAAKNQSDFAETVIMPGDPLRAKYIAENFLNDAKQISNVRGILAYTGTYKGKTVSTMASGMGMPSTSIYVNELFNNYSVERIIRTGTSIAFNDDINIGDVIIATSASTDSNMNNWRFKYNLAPSATYSVIKKLEEAAEKNSINYHIGPIFSSDMFYLPESMSDMFEEISKYGHLAIDMEASAIFTLAQRHRKEAGALLYIADHIKDLDSSISSSERERSLDVMIASALDSIVI